MRLSTACVLLACAACVFSGGVHQIPLVLRQNHTALEQLQKSHRYETVNVDGEDSPIPAIPMSLVNMYVWNMGFLNVGQPEKTISVDFNIYLSDSYLIDKIADSNSNYNGSESWSFKKSTKQYEAPDHSNGYWATDYFKIPLSELEVYHQPFGWIYHVIGGFISFTQSTLGLGPVKDSNSFLHRIKNQLDDPLYSIYFEPVDQHPTMQPLSLTFGAIDSHCRKEPLFFTDYVNVSIAEEHFRPWAFHLDGFLIHPANGDDGLSFRLDEDAGIWMFPMIMGPEAHVKRIARRLGAVRAGPDAFFEYSIGCDKRSTAPSVFFRVGHRFLELKASDYIIKAIDEESKPECFLAFASRFFDLTIGDKWLVGTPLFNSKCLIVDFGRNKIGFAAAKTL